MHLQEILKQPQYSPMSLADEVILLYAGTKGYADEIPVEKMKDWETGLLHFVESGYPEITKALTMEARISPETETRLGNAIEAYAATWHSTNPQQ